MAAKSFLTPEETKKALQIVCAERFDGSKVSSAGAATSSYLSQVLTEKFLSHASWRKAMPILLGSWSRNELCSRSDLDLLFLGPEHDVGEFVSWAQKEGFKIRSRLPEDPEDWTRGVQPFDVMSLLKAKAVFEEHFDVVELQKKKLFEAGSMRRKQLFSAIIEERTDREKRYDSISNFLEPNLKYGKGGLRDLEQALIVRQLFPERFLNAKKVFAELEKAKSHLLTLRHYLHLQGGGDYLSSTMQFSWAKDKRLNSPIQYMSFLSRVLADVSFYTEWVEETARASQKSVIKIKSKEIKTPKKRLESQRASKSKLGGLAHFKNLVKVPSLQNQLLLRTEKWTEASVSELVPLFMEEFQPTMNDRLLRAMVQSHILDELCPEFKKIRGLVQHDQYHRYSCDAHTLQAMRLVLRTKKSSQYLGKLKNVVKEMREKDWQILLWTALFHDLGKGRQEDHAKVGEELVQLRLKKWGVSQDIIDETKWMVANHLIMSTAAFRMNPMSSSTWAEMFKRGVRGDRIHRLALFTAIDICATNPEAWNEWKSTLMFQFVSALESEPALHVEQLVSSAQKIGITLSKGLLSSLDLRLISELPTKKLLLDLKKSIETDKELPILLLKGKKGEYWVRFHQKHDRAGLFYEFCKLLSLVGVNIIEAYAMTNNELGVYDWFRVRSSRQMAMLKKIMNRIDANAGSTQAHSNLKFSVIETVATNDHEMTLSFRGKDQKGALLAAAKALFDAGF